MTNKPMLSVERELLESAIRILQGAGAWTTADGLRALLDKPEIRSRKVGIKPLSGRYYLAECKSCGWVGSSEECNDDCLCLQSVGNDCCYAETDEIGTDRLLELVQAGEFERPAAQHQGEPIKLSDDVRGFLQEWIDSSTGGEDEDIDYDFVNQLGVLLGPLYAAPPAQQQGAPSEVIAFGIQVEKMLCDALGREWSASGISINSLVAEFKDKHQGEPVLFVDPDDLSNPNFVGVGGKFKPDSVHTKPLYTEQPAPVATGTTSEKYRAELYDEVWQNARDMGFANVTDALVKLSAPVAVDYDGAAKKLAECMDYPWEHMPEQGRQSMREHAKAVVDAARLNGVNP